MVVEHIIDVGPQVICDFCGEDYTQSEAQGGLLFGSKAICPVCTPPLEKSLATNNETQFIRARCPEGMSFRAWVLSLRDGDNRVITRSFETMDEFLAYIKPDEEPDEEPDEPDEPDPEADEEEREIERQQEAEEEREIERQQEAEEEAQIERDIERQQEEREIERDIERQQEEAQEDNENPS